MADDDVIEKLLSMTTKYEGPTGETVREAFGRFQPSANLLQRALDAVFWASVSAEEARPALCRVRLSCTKEPALRFDEKRELSAKALRKLSPLLDLPGNALLADESGMLTGVAGMLHQDVAIVATRPATIVVTQGSRILGRLEGGEWSFVDGDKLDLSLLMTTVLPGDDARHKFMRASLLPELIQQARVNGRGAAFVLVEGEPTGIESIACRASIDELPAWFRELVARGDTPPTEDQVAAQSFLLERVRAMLSAGCGIDGATVIDVRDFKLVGFGAKLSATGTGDHDVDVTHDGRSWSSMKISELGGMRHQSAARLVFSDHTATVLIVSQDGPASLVTWAITEERVVIFKGLDRYLI